MRRALIGLGIGAALALAGCAPDGDEGGACFGNGTCNQGLSCREDICQAVTAGGSDGGATDDADAGSTASPDGGSDTSTGPDGGSPTDAGTPQTGSGWLDVVGDRIYTENGELWVGRGANLHDTRSCGACAFNPPNVDEVIRRLDALVDDWGADFIRLDLEAYAQDFATSQGMAQYGDVIDDPGYLADVHAIVDRVGEKDGVYIMLSLWVHPSFTDMGWPSADTTTVWERLASEFGDQPHVLYGLVNEPESNYDGSLDADVWTAMNDTVAAIRAVEASDGNPNHVVAVQGTGGWSRFLDYYVDHPITAAEGANVAYEVHVYDPESAFESMVVTPGASIPVIIGEYGPAAEMTEADCEALQTLADAQGIPHLAWTFHMRCPPDLLVDNSGGSCGIGMNLEPTSWGQIVRDHLQGAN